MRRSPMRWARTGHRPVGVSQPATPVTDSDRRRTSRWARRSGARRCRSVVCSRRGRRAPTSRAPGWVTDGGGAFRRHPLLRSRAPALPARGRADARGAGRGGRPERAHDQRPGPRRRLGAAPLLPQTVLAGLGLREAPDQLPLATLTEHLRTRRALLVLDNCEHLVAACARLVDALLRGCPRVRVLTTSRELLGVAGEVA